MQGGRLFLTKALCSSCRYGSVREVRTLSDRAADGARHTRVCPSPQRRLYPGCHRARSSREMSRPVSKMAWSWRAPSLPVSPDCHWQKLLKLWSAWWLITSPGCVGAPSEPEITGRKRSSNPAPALSPPQLADWVSVDG